MWGVTPQNSTHFSGALVPAKPALCVCCLWSWLSGSPVWPEVGHQEYWFWGLWGGALEQVKVSCYLYPGLEPLGGVQSDLQMNATCAGIGGTWQRPTL